MGTKVDIGRLDAAASALRDLDLDNWSEETLRKHLGDLSAALCAVDAALSRVADQVRARGLRVEESLPG